MNITKNKEFSDLLVGKTVVKASMDDIDGVRTDGSTRHYERWNYQGGDIEIVFNDGSILTTFSSGYDAYGNEVNID